MRAVAVLSSATSAFLVAAVATGSAPSLFLRRGGRPRERRESWLVQAGLALTPQQFWAGSAALGAIAFALLVVATGTPTVSVAPSLGVAVLPRLYYGRRRTARMREVQERWPDALRELTACIAAGMSLPQALCRLADAGPEPLRAAFSRYPLLQRMVGVVPALEVIKAELADPTSDRIIEVLILAHERGGRIVGDVLRDLAESTTEAVRTLEEIATDGLEQRINARAVLLIPWLILLGMTLAPGGYRDFYRSSGGVVTVAIGAVLSIVGTALVGRLSREQREDRVLAGREAAP